MRMLWDRGSVSSSRERRLLQFIQEPPRCSEVGRLEPLRESTIDGRKRSVRLIMTVLLAPQQREARSRSQFPGQGRLPAGQLERARQPILGLGEIRSARGCQELALESEHFRRMERFPISLAVSDGFIDDSHGIVKLT